VKRLRENAPETRHQFKKVWLWDDYPDRGGGDLGIDLVAETLRVEEGDDDIGVRQSN
jgi:predicted helicase